MRKKRELHGMSHTPEYNSWDSMRKRCKNPKQKSYAYYGGRGISVCRRWDESFMSFYEDMGPKPTPKHQIGRIDNDGNYCPENCRWETPLENSLNKRTPKNNTTGHKGISWESRKNAYIVRGWRGGKRRYVGLYRDLDRAILAKKAFDEGRDIY